MQRRATSALFRLNCARLLEIKRHAPHWLVGAREPAPISTIVDLLITYEKPRNGRLKPRGMFRTAPPRTIDRVCFAGRGWGSHKKSWMIKATVFYKTFPRADRGQRGRDAHATSRLLHGRFSQIPNQCQQRFARPALGDVRRGAGA